MGASGGRAILAPSRGVGAERRQSAVVGTAEDPARIEQLEAELRQLRERDAVARQEIATLQDENHVLREQQTATAEVLRVIASSPSNVNAALQTIAETAHRLSASRWASIRVIEGDTSTIAAVVGDSPRSLHVVGMRISIAEECRHLPRRFGSDRPFTQRTCSLRRCVRGIRGRRTTGNEPPCMSR